MTPENADQPGNTQDPNAAEGAATPMLDAETYGQIVDDNKPAGGQTQADMEDDSLRMDREAMSANGPAPDTADNPPRELTNPSDRAYTLPEEQGPTK